jgi:hypothetical protein
MINDLSEQHETKYRRVQWKKMFRVTHDDL